MLKLINTTQTNAMQTPIKEPPSKTHGNNEEFQQNTFHNPMTRNAPLANAKHVTLNERIPNPTHARDVLCNAGPV